MRSRWLSHPKGLPDRWVGNRATTAYHADQPLEKLGRPWQRAMTRIEQRFGSIQIVAEGDDCEINNRAFGMNLKRSTFRLSDVRTVMVSSRKNWLGTREWFLHLLGHDSEIVKFEASYRSDADAAATFIRHLIRESKRSAR